MEQEKKKRPDLLTVLCILTFVGSGLAAFSNLFIFLSFEEVKSIANDYFTDLPGFEVIFSGGKKFFMIGFILYTFSIYGALQMWKLRKIGLHFYIAAQIFILVLPVVTLDSYKLPVLSIFVTFAFVIGYVSQLKFMS